jgi:ABC-type multidrug transport system ATPase subunit
MAAHTSRVEPVIESEISTCGTATMRPCAGIDLTIQRGEIFAFLGPNGAGKTPTVEDPRRLP